MPFVIPQMPLEVHIWRTTPIPPTDPPDVICMGNLAWGKRVGVPSTGGTGTLGVVLMTMTLLVPKGTDIRGDAEGITPDIVECPAGSGRYYVCYFVDDLGKGFLNEHRGAILGHGYNWPVPTP